jgi:hypothetical protein
VTSGPEDTVRTNIAKLLASRGGFVVFDDGNENEYVQYALEEDGLMLNWPAGYTSIAPDAVAALLREVGVTPDVETDGVYANFGRDADRAVTFTMRAFRELYRKDPPALQARLELD